MGLIKFTVTSVAVGMVTLAAVAEVGAQQMHRSAMTSAPMVDSVTAQPVSQAVAHPDRYMRVHRTLGTIALASFGTALVTGAASGNLGKLMDSTACCPDGGTRNASARSFDRALVKVGIASYSGAAAMALYNLTVRRPPSANPRTRHKAHRWLAMAHGAAFLTSAVTGAMMGDAQETDPAKFARLARVHVAANIAFVPLLTAAFSNIVFEHHE